MSFVLSCESPVDMPYKQVATRNIPVLFYTYRVDGVDYPDDMGRDPNAMPAFYAMLDQGKLPQTSQVNQFEYEEFFTRLVEQYEGDVLHITLGTGMTQGYANAQAAAATVEEAHPGRRIVVLDSMCSSSGYGMLVDYAADLRDEGQSLDEVAAWVTDNRQCVHHQFFSTRLDFYRRSGRMSGPQAALGSVLDICPIMRLDDKGCIIAYDKVRGKKAAIKRTVSVMFNHAKDGAAYAGKCFICNSNCIETAQALRAAIEEQFPQLAGKIAIFDIGTIIASHCGPGTVAVFFLGDKREPSGV